MKSDRITLQKIADHAGVHVTTVSLALRESTKLPVETRQRLQQLAREMGYAPDPALSALMAYRARTRAPAYQSTVAWLNGYPDRAYPLRVPTLRNYLAGAADRASSLGYKLEEHHLHEPGLTPAGLQRRLATRGVRGLLVLPMGAPTSMPDFAWKDFSAVAFGYSLVEPQLHRVSNHQFRTAMKLFRELRRLGYRRIGLSLVEAHDRRINLALSSAFGAYDYRTPEEERVPLNMRHDWEDRESFLKWLRRARPQAVVTHDSSIHEWTREAGIKVPEDLALAFFNVDACEKKLSGVHQNDFRVGQVAFDTMVNLLHSNERGIPDVAQHVLVDGEWLERKTTRRIGPPAPWFLDMPEDLEKFRPPLTTPPAPVRKNAKPKS